jgi:hypothetical protein
LTNLKETLVVTKGDNYVGAAEPQLREKLVDLYAKVADSFYKPNSAEMGNLGAIETRFNDAKTNFKKIKDKELKKLTSLLSPENKFGQIPMKSYDEFIKEP